MVKIVVTGATGNIGRTLVRVLAEADEDVTAVARQQADMPEGVQYRRADLADPESLRPVVEGADALFLLVPGAGEGLDPHALVGVAKEGGVRRITLVSSQAAGTRPEAVSHGHLRAFEAAVQQSGLDWTVLRPGGFDSNAFMWTEMVRAQLALAAPFGDVGLPLVDPADIAEVAAVVLRDQSHASRTYVLTGPSPVSPRGQAQAIGEALGVPVQFGELSRDDARAQMLQFMPEVVVDSTLSILGEPLPLEQQVSPDVSNLLGRPPRTFADWAARNIAAFR